MTRHALIAVALLAAGSAAAAEKTLDRTFTVAPGGTLLVDADSASVKVTGSDSNQVVVHIVARGSEESLAKTSFDAVQKDNGVTVTLKRSPKQGWFSWGSWNNDERIEVTVPRRYSVDARTGGGSIDVRDTTGAATLRTSGGSITAKNLVGNVLARTSGGGIVADTIRGDVDADTSGGGVRLLQIDGKIRGNTSGGGVRVSLSGANRGISATTSGGGIEVIVPRGTSGEVRATTSGGGVSSELDLTHSTIKDGRIEGTLNGGGPPIEAHTSGGSVSLRYAD